MGSGPCLSWDRSRSQGPVRPLLADDAGMTMAEFDMSCVDLASGLAASAVDAGPPRLPTCCAPRGGQQRWHSSRESAKTASRTRFAEGNAPRAILESVRYHSDRPKQRGPMTLDLLTPVRYGGYKYWEGASKRTDGVRRSSEVSCANTGIWPILEVEFLGVTRSSCSI